MKRLNHSFVGRSQDKLNCLLGVHDGPKVAMPGDRLVNGTGVSSETKGPVNNRRITSSVRTAVTNAALGYPSLGFLKTHGDCRLGVHGSIPTVSASDHFREAALTWERVTLTNLRRHQNMTDCRIGVHGSLPGGCGFDSHRRNLQLSAVAQWQSTVSLWFNNLVGHLKRHPD